MSRNVPPPRKPPRPPKRSQKRDVLADALAELEASPEVSAPTPIASERDPLDGEWLYKENDVVRGPVSADRLLEGAREGTFANDTPIAREVGQWQALHTVPVFADAWEEGARHREQEKKREAVEKRRASVRRARLVLLAFVFLIPFSACAVVSRTVVAARPWDDSDKWRKQAPPLIEIPKRPEKPPVRVAALQTKPEEKPDGDKPETAPDDKKGEESKATDEKAEASSSKKNTSRRSRRRGSRSSKASTKTEKEPAKVDEKKEDKSKKVASARKEKVAEKLSDKQVNSGLKRGIKGIGACLKAETERNEAMPPTVTVAFSINNAGKAIQIKVLERQVRNGPLTPCMRKAVGKIRWPKTYGENRYVEVPFRIKKRK